MKCYFAEKLLVIEKEIKLEDIQRNDVHYHVTINKKNFEDYVDSFITLRAKLQKEYQETLCSKLRKFQSLKYEDDIVNFEHVSPQLTENFFNLLKDNEIRDLDFRMVNQLDSSRIKLDILALVTPKTKRIHLQFKLDNSYFEFLLNQLEKNEKFAGVESIVLFRDGSNSSNSLFDTIKQDETSNKIVTKRKICLTKMTLYGDITFRNIDFINLDYLHFVGYGIKIINCDLRQLTKLTISTEKNGLDALEFLHNFIIEYKCKKLETVYISTRKSRYLEMQQAENILKRIKRICPNFKNISNSSYL